MGGNAIQNVRRYEAVEYFPLVDDVLGKLRSLFPGHRVEVLKAFRQKESFGDMDVLLESFGFEGINWRSLLVEHFQTRQVNSNGGVHSFEYKDFQIDLNLILPHNFDTSMSYFAWNDLGNFMGRVAHKFGFKYGHEGLIYVFRDNTYEFGQIVVSRDPGRICEFLGYDPQRFLHGFDTLEEIFLFASSTPFFNKAIYDYDNRNHTARVRDRKRKNYHGFLEWMQDKDLPAYPWETMDERGVRVAKTEHMERAYQFFPQFKLDYETMLTDFNLWVKAKELFNGQVVASVTGLIGLELGNVMKHLKTILPPREELVKMSSTEVESWILKNKP